MISFLVQDEEGIPRSSEQGPMEGSQQDRKCLLLLSGSSLSSQSTGTGNIDTGWIYCEQQIFRILSLQHLELLEDR